jgi:hypothetical protein
MDLPTDADNVADWNTTIVRGALCGASRTCGPPCRSTVKCFALAFSCLVCALPAAAQFTPFDYHIGKLAFHEQPGRLTITVPSSRTLHARLLAGGGEWPPVLLAENGQISIGTVLIDSATGKVLNESTQARGLTVTPGNDGFALRRNGRSCTLSRATLGLSRTMSPRAYLQSRHVQLVASDTGVLALTRHESQNGRAYAIKKIDTIGCKVSATHALGDPDYLVELGWSRHGGWWLTGSIEPTLLRSTDGMTWTRVPLDAGISGLVSSYVVSERDIWLAALLADPAHPDQDPAELLHSSDGGNTWRGVQPGSALSRTMPLYWLEGARRAAPSPRPGPP